jgi:hypothetical protein
MTTALLSIVGGSTLLHAAGGGKDSPAADGEKAVKAEVKEDFTRLDKDANGYLSEKEFGAMDHPAMDHPATAFIDADVDGNKRVTLVEYAGHSESRWMGTSKPEEPASAPTDNSAPRQPTPGGGY